MVMARAVTWMGLEDASKAPPGCGFQVVVGALDVAFGKGLAGSAVQQHAGSRRHIAVQHPRGAGEFEYLIRRRVAGVISPGLAVPVAKNDVALLLGDSMPCPGGNSRPGRGWY